jgi:broad specificity phosphatase PhoE
MKTIHILYTMEKNFIPQPLTTKIEFQEKTRKYFLEILEEEMMKDKIKDKYFTLNVLKKLISIGGEEYFISLLKASVKNKKILFIRHAQAQHNEYNIYYREQGHSRPKMFDPELTEEGKEQCDLITEFVKKLEFKFEAIFASPLRRALQTLNIIKPGLSINSGNDQNFYVSELIREQVSCIDTHIGKSLTEMKDSYQEWDHLNYKYLLKENWWSYTKDEEYKAKNFQVEKMSLFTQRMVLFALWIILRNENNICMVSHSRVFKALANPKKFSKAKHGGFYILCNNYLVEKIQVFIYNNLK